MEIQNQRLDSIVSVTTQSLLISRYLMGETVRKVAVMDETKLPLVPKFATRRVKSGARFISEVTDAHAFAERLTQEAKAISDAEDEQYIEAYGVTKRAYIDQYVSKARQDVSTKAAKDEERARKEHEARADYLMDNYSAVVEPSPSLEYESFQDAVIGRQLGQAAFSGISSGQ